MNCGFAKGVGTGGPLGVLQEEAGWPTAVYLRRRKFGAPLGSRGAASAGMQDGHVMPSENQVVHKPCVLKMHVLYFS